MRPLATVCLYRPWNTATASSLPEFAIVCGRVHAFGATRKPWDRRFNAATSAATGSPSPVSQVL